MAGCLLQAVRLSLTSGGSPDPIVGGPDQRFAILIQDVILIQDDDPDVSDFGVHSSSRSRSRSIQHVPRATGSVLPNCGGSGVRKRQLQTGSITNRMRENHIDTSIEWVFTEDLLCGTPAGPILSRGRQAQERSSPKPIRRKGLDQSLPFQHRWIPALAHSSICECVFKG
jgi:hypothetical protein